MYQSSTIENWILVIYETRRRFRQEIAEQMVGNLVKGGRSVGKAIQTSSNALVLTSSRNNHQPSSAHEMGVRPRQYR
jgi:hypothetical protein